MMNFEITREWLATYARSVTRQQFALIAPAEEWPASRRSPVAGWQARAVGRRIANDARYRFERTAMQHARLRLAAHQQAASEARDQLAAMLAGMAPLPPMTPRVLVPMPTGVM